jgi:hypothetical protein
MESQGPSRSVVATDQNGSAGARPPTATPTTSSTDINSGTSFSVKLAVSSCLMWTN